MQQDSRYKYVVRLYWMNGDTISDWNEKCAQALEIFGLPGDKFITHPTADYLEFIFKDEKDAIYFNLACV